jgi:hypothetical protein
MNLSVGQRLRATTTGYEYVVKAIDDDETLVSGPHGPLLVDNDDLRDELDQRKVELVGWR